jgi:hypothetical protein
MLRECLAQRNGDQFAPQALAWVLIQPHTAQATDVLANIVAAAPTDWILSEVQKWLESNWYRTDQTSVVMGLLRADSQRAFLLGRYFLERCYSSNEEWENREDLVSTVVTWLLSESVPKDRAQLLDELLSATIEMKGWSSITGTVLSRAPAPKTNAVAFAKRWLRERHFDARPDCVICQLIDIDPSDEEVIQFALEILAHGLEIKIAEDSIREKLREIGHLPT